MRKYLYLSVLSKILGLYLLYENFLIDKTFYIFKGGGLATNAMKFIVENGMVT